MESLRDSVRLRAYGQRDPLVEYRREAHALYRQMLAQFDEWMAENKKRMEEAAHDASRSVASPISAIAPAAPKQYEGTGRNDACPCGAKDASGNPLKYKRCHGA
jgi:preprotein translocase subunit SecA